MVYMKRALSQAESNAEKLAPKIEDALVEPKNGTDHENIDIQAGLFTYLWTSRKCPKIKRKDQDGLPECRLEEF